jgi:hypothetical protein
MLDGNVVEIIVTKKLSKIHEVLGAISILDSIEFTNRGGFLKISLSAMSACTITSFVTIHTNRTRVNGLHSQKENSEDYLTSLDSLCLTTAGLKDHPLGNFNLEILNCDIKKGYL